MPDIALRFHKDMLVLSTPLVAALERQGVDVERDLEYLNLVEPEAVRDALRLESVAGAQCLVAATEGIAPARLARHGMEERAEELASSALEVARGLSPQHLIAEVGPCGLPLDASSKASLNENRSQYARAIRAFGDASLDAFLLSGFARADDLKCALMGARQATDIPVFASVVAGADGLLADGRTPLEEALSIMGEYGAQAAGFSTGAGPEEAAALTRRASEACGLPLLVQLHVARRNPRQGGITSENPYYCPDVMVQAAVALRAAGAQFLRACGQATPAYTGALVAATAGFDVAPARQGA